MSERVYLDWNATAPLRAEARAAMAEAMDLVGNPSSVHAEGRAARAQVERARAALSEALGAQGFDIVFTSGATEAAALALGAGWSRVVSSPVEHECIAAHAGALPGWNWLEVGRDGVISEGALGRCAPGPGTLVVVQLANSETGIVQDPAAAPSAVAGTGAAVLADAVQHVGKLPLALSWQEPALYMVSGHKFGGPKGAGALLVPEGTDLPALLRGGGQEMGRRSGTENVIGIAGLAAAATAAQRDLADGTWDRVAELRNILEMAIEADSPETIFVGKGSQRLPNTTLMVTPGWKGETQVMSMDLAGFAVSAGSACSSGKLRDTRVLGAMGYADEAHGALRVSLGPATTRDEVLRFAGAWCAARRKRRARAA